jgi:hypothetical protein
VKSSGELLDSRLEEIRDNLRARIAEAPREGWLGEVEGVQISLAGAEDKLTQLYRRLPESTSGSRSPLRNDHAGIVDYCGISDWRWMG